MESLAVVKEEQAAYNSVPQSTGSVVSGFGCPREPLAAGSLYSEVLASMADDPTSLESLMRGISDDSLMNLAGDPSALSGLDTDGLAGLGDILGPGTHPSRLPLLGNPAASTSSSTQSQCPGFNGAFGAGDSHQGQALNGPDLKDPQAIAVLQSLLGRLEQRQHQKTPAPGADSWMAQVGVGSSPAAHGMVNPMAGAYGLASSASSFTGLPPLSFGGSLPQTPTSPALSPTMGLPSGLPRLQSNGMSQPGLLHQQQQQPGAASPQDLLLQQLLQMQQPAMLPGLSAGANTRDIMDTLDRQLSAQAALQANTLNMLATLKHQATQINTMPAVGQCAADQGHCALSSPPHATTMPSGDAAGMMAGACGIAGVQPLTPPSAVSSPPPSGSLSSGVLSPKSTNSSPAVNYSSLSEASPDFDGDTEVGSDERPSQLKGKAKTVRKTSHNRIEKKYRRSINDRIQQLQRRFSGPGSGKTLPKSGVLQKVLEYLDQVDGENSVLRQANDALHRSHTMALSQLSSLQCQLGHSSGLSKQAVAVARDVHRQTVAEETMPSPTSSSTSGIVTDCGPLSPQSGMSETKPNVKYAATPESSKLVPSSRGMPESSKPLYCLVLVFCVTLFASPMEFFSAGGTSGIHSGGRALLAFFGVANESESTLSLVAGYVLQVVIMLLGLSWILIHGEPYVGPNSSESIKFRRHRQQADAYLSQGSYGQAVVQLEAGLHAINRRLPLSRANLYFSVVWQVIHGLLLLTGVSHLVHWVVSTLRFVLRLEDRAVHGEVEVETCKMASQAARVYHQLHGLQLTGHASYKPAVSLYIALCSFNLAKSAGSALDRSELAETYATVAIGLRASLPAFIPIWPVTRILLRRARSVCHPPPPLLTSLLHPDCVKYMDTPTASAAGGVLWSSPTTPGRPLTAVSRQLRHHLFRQTLYQLLVAHQRQVKVGDAARPPQAGAVCEELPPHTVATIKGNLSMVRQLCRIAPSTPPAKASLKAVGTDVDVVSLWWLDVVTVSVRWLASQDSEAAELYASIMQQPKALIESSDPLPKAVLACFIARRALVSNASESRLLDLCSRASVSLAATIGQNKAYEPSMDTVPNTTQLVQLLCCDWLLSTRVGTWQKSQGTANGAVSLPVAASPPSLNAFTRDLSLLQKLSHSSPVALAQVYVYEAAARYMAGSNPHRAHYLLANGKPSSTVGV